MVNTRYRGPAPIGGAVTLVDEDVAYQGTATNPLWTEDVNLANGTALAMVTGTGTAGTPAAGVVTVQGITNGKALNTAVASAAAPTYAEGAQVPLSTDLAGNLRTSGGGGGGGGGTSSNFAAAFPAAGTAIGVKDSTGVNMTFLQADAANALTISAAALPLPAGAATEATLAGVLTTTAFQARINTLGQKTMANSTPMVIASDQSAVPVSGTVTITPSGTQTVVGNKTNNNAAPGATNVGALVAVANAAAPSWSEGNEVLLSADLSGNLRSILSTGSTTAVTQATASNLNATVVGNQSLDGSAPGANHLPAIVAYATSAAPSWTNGRETALSVDLSGQLRIVPAANIGATGAAVPASAAFIGGLNESSALQAPYIIKRIPVKGSDYAIVVSQVPNTGTASAPTSASVGVASASAVASNASRTGLILTNNSNNTISIGIGSAAVLNSGITLYPGGVFSMDQNMFSTGTINAIASAAASTLGVQEFT